MVDVRTYINVRTYVLQTYVRTYVLWSLVPPSCRRSLIQTVPHTYRRILSNRERERARMCKRPVPGRTPRPPRTYSTVPSVGSTKRSHATSGIVIASHQGRAQRGLRREGGGSQGTTYVRTTYAMPKGGRGEGHPVVAPPLSAASRQIETSDHQYRGTTSKDTKGRQRSDVVTSAQ